MKTGRIYVITNLVNGKYYVGQTTASNPLYRFRDHIRGSNANNLLSRAIAKYGQRAFIFEIVAEASDLSTLNTLERLWITLTGANRPGVGYNLSDGGLNYTRTEETRAKMSAAMKGHIPWNKGTKGLTVGWNKGKKMPVEVVTKLRAAHLGVPLSEPHRKSLNLSRLGRRHTAESRLKMSVACKGRERSDAHCQKLSDAQLGKPAWNKGLKGAQVAWNKGIPMLPHVAETLKAHRHITLSAEHKSKISAALRGRMPAVNIRRIETQLLKK
jgi:group I intron endonuclease